MSNNTVITGFRTQAEKDAEGRKQPLILQELTIRPINRKTQDIANWRNAMRAAEGTIPRRTELYDLYEDILLDGHLQSVVEKRILAVTNAEWQFLDADGKEVDAMNDWIDTPDFELIVEEVLNSKLWGYTMLEFDFYPDGSWGVFNVPRKHMRPELGLVCKEQTTNAGGINVREGFYASSVMEAGKPKDLGKLLSACQYVIYKRGNFGDWAQFAEIFGMPLIDAVWDGYNEDQRLKLLQALEQMGGGGQLVRPAGTTVEFVQGGTNNPTGDLYNNLIKACDAQISKLILGQTETTESSSSSGYAQATVHADTENDINISDIKYVRRLLNKRLIKILQDNGIDTKGGYFHVKNPEERISKKEWLDIYVKLKNEAQIPISDETIYDTFGIDKPDDYDEQKAILIEQAKAQSMSQMPQFGLTLNDIIRLKDEGFFLEAPKWVGAEISKNIKLFYQKSKCCDSDQHRQPIALADDNTKSTEERIQKLFDGRLNTDQIEPEYYFKIAKVLEDAVKTGMDIHGKLNAYDPNTKLFEKLKNNVYAFSAAKNLSQLQEYKKNLTDKNGEKVSYGRFRQSVTEIDVEFNDNYLRTEVNSAVAHAQMATKWKYLQKFDMLEYRTVGDNRVRKEHALLNGLKLPPNDPLWKEIYPPNGWNCRCTVIPAQGSKQDDEKREVAKAYRSQIKPYFRKNVGQNEVIFHDDHPYLTNTKNSRESQFMAERDYAMRPVDSIMQDEKLPIASSPKDKETAKKLWQEMNKKVKTIDGLDWELNDRWEHVVEDHQDENRWKYISKVSEVLQEADEVWSTEGVVNGKRIIYKRYIKYFEGKPIVVSYDVESPEKWTIYSSNDSDNYNTLKGRVRKGILIHRK